MPHRWGLPWAERAELCYHCGLRLWWAIRLGYQMMHFIFHTRLSATCLASMCSQDLPCCQHVVCSTRCPDKSEVEGVWIILPTSKLRFVDLHQGPKCEDRSTTGWSQRSFPTWVFLWYGSVLILVQQGSRPECNDEVGLLFYGGR